MIIQTRTAWMNPLQNQESRAQMRGAALGLGVVVLIGLALAWPQSANAQTLTTLYNFCSQASCTDGNQPLATLVQGSDGNFYGTTGGGGVGGACTLGGDHAGCGTVFKITPSGTFTKLYDFCAQANCADGSQPFGTLLQGSDGNFYGTTEAGGQTNPNYCAQISEAGCGTVFKITKEGALTTLYTFCSQGGTSCTDGAIPTAGLVEGSDGNFYGTTTFGGTLGGGTFFQMTPSGTLTTIYDFCASSSCHIAYDPGGVIQVGNGNFYGTTYEASGGGGMVYEVTPSGTLTTLYTFCSQLHCTDGENPEGTLVLGSDGNFYGTTSTYGGFGNPAYGGTVFKITPEGSLTTLGSFCLGCATGDRPYASLIQASDGNFYGTTLFGGTHGTCGPGGDGCGSVYKVTPGGVLSAVYGFCSVGTYPTCLDGVEPYAGLVQGADGRFYGTTSTGGANDGGTVFVLAALPVGSVSPGSLTFAGQVEDTTSPSQPVILSNTGPTPLPVASIVPSAGFGETDDCNGSVAAGQSCTINVTFTPTAAGTQTGTLTITDSSNGVAGSTQTVVLSGTGIPTLTIIASSPSVIYGGTVPAITPIYSGFVNGDTAASLTTVPTCTTTATSASPVGSYPATCSGAVDANYAISYTAGTVTIAPAALIIAADSGSMTYGGTVPAITASYAGFVNGDSAGSLRPAPTCLTTATSSSAVGSYPSTCSGAADPNYMIAYLGGTITVGPAPLTITAPSTTINPGSAIPALTPTYSGFVNGQNAGSLTNQPTCITTATSSSPVGSYPITCSGAVDSNYNIGYVAGILTITGPVVSITTPSPGGLSFPSQVFNTASAAQSVTVNNTGSATLAITSIGFTGANPGDYSETDNCGSPIAPGGSCTISVTFAPSAVGTRTASLNVTDNANGMLGSVQTVALAGTAVGIFTHILDFDGSNGASPIATALSQGIDGNLYGTTRATVFMITPGGMLTTLHSFTGPLGDGPNAGLTEDTNGNLYGTTAGGGSGQEGTIFEITARGTLTTLYNFCSQTGCADGANPWALVRTSDGNLYGTTYDGGAYGSGTVFRVTPSGTLTTLYSFCSQAGCADGELPDAGLVLGTDGYLYGTTGGNAANGGAAGTAFKINPSNGALTTLINFGANNPPVGIVQGSDGNFYGTTGITDAGPEADGTIFRMTSAGSLNTIFQFSGVGVYTSSGLTEANDTNLYGATQAGGTNSEGTIFTITPGGTLTTLYDLSFSSGVSPLNPLFQATNGILYGTTSGGGAYADGTIFSLNVGLGPFVQTVPPMAGVGSTVTILGNNLTNTTAVNFNGTPALFHVVSDTEIQTTVPAGATTGAVQVTTPSAPLNSWPAFQVTAQPVLAQANVSTNALTFGNQTYGSTSAPQSVVLTNSSPATLFISSITASGFYAIHIGLGGGTTVFVDSPSFGETDNCNGVLFAFTSCTINVTFTPALAASFGGSLTITDNANGTPGSTQTVSLAATGTPAPLVITASNASMTYGGAVPAITPSYAGFVSGDTAASLTTPSTCTTTATSSSPVGTYPATCSGAVDPNYAITYVAGTVTVNPAPLTISAPSATITAGSVIPAFTPTYSGFVNGDGAASLTSPPTCVTTATITSPVGSYPITCSGALDSNYNIGYVAGTLTIIAPVVSLSPASLAFGTDVIGTTSAARKITLTNTGATPLTLTSITLGGPNAADFSSASNCGASLAPAAKCTIDVTFTPSVVSAETASLVVTDSAANSPQSVALSGTGERPVTLSAASLGFGNVGENSPSASKTITLTNHQAVALAVTTITTGNPDYTETDNCVGTVAAKGTCTINITLTPSVLGTDAGTLSVNDNASNTPQTATLTGAGVLPATLSTASLRFGNVPQATPSASKNVTLSNAEAAPLAVSITTGNPDFAESDDCNGSVPAKSKCTITITFTPSIVGAETATLTVTDAASNSPQATALSGTGIAQATATPALLAWGTVEVGDTGAAKDVSLTNNLSTVLTIGSISFTGVNAGDFAVSASTCGATLAASSKCTISVTFTPGAAGTRTAALSVADSANNSPQTVALSGTGK